MHTHVYMYVCVCMYICVYIEIEKYICITTTNNRPSSSCIVLPKSFLIPTPVSIGCRLYAYACIHVCMCMYVYMCIYRNRKIYMYNNNKQQTIIIMHRSSQIISDSYTSQHRLQIICIRMYTCMYVYVCIYVYI